VGWGFGEGVGAAAAATVVPGSAAVEIAIKPDFKKLRREFGWDSLLTGRSSFCGPQRPEETEHTPLGMHARCQREMVEKKRRGVLNGAANSVKLTETANAVDSLDVQVECLGRPANIQA
jgi:hypothetical protein